MADRLIDMVHEYEAQQRWAAGQKPSFSHGVCGSVTAGYGELDPNGYWQFPLYPGEDYLDQTLKKWHGKTVGR